MILLLAVGRIVSHEVWRTFFR